MRHDGIPAYGSATELVMSLSLASAKLRTAQLGDSTYVVLDNEQRARFVSTEQQHNFNDPYQLKIPLPDWSSGRDEAVEAARKGPRFYLPLPTAQTATANVCPSIATFFANNKLYGRFQVCVHINLLCIRELAPVVQGHVAP
ncbi:Protein phosphatase 2C 7 [Coemansia spiralis]|nr:Protein phosphatase 2C 7 [Coemansia spiralis]